MAWRSESALPTYKASQRVFPPAPLVAGHRRPYMGRAGLPGASGNSSPGPISILRELALRGSWSGYLAPTCASRPWEDETPTAHGGSALFFFFALRRAPQGAEGRGAARGAG